MKFKLVQKCARVCYNELGKLRVRGNMKYGKRKRESI